MSRLYALTWTDPAANDLLAIIEYVADEGGQPAARKLHQRLMQRLESLTQHPLRGRVVPELRELGLTAFRDLVIKPYRAIYRIHDNRIVLLAFLDARRDLQDLLLERALMESPAASPG